MESFHLKIFLLPYSHGMGIHFTFNDGIGRLQDENVHERADASRISRYRANVQVRPTFQCVPVKMSSGRPGAHVFMVSLVL